MYCVLVIYCQKASGCKYDVSRSTIHVKVTISQNIYSSSLHFLVPVPSPPSPLPFTPSPLPSPPLLFLLSFLLSPPLPLQEHKYLTLAECRKRAPVLDWSGCTPGWTYVYAPCIAVVHHLTRREEGLVTGSVGCLLCEQEVLCSSVCTCVSEIRMCE